VAADIDAAALLTRRGVLTAVTAVALGVIGRILGVMDLYVLATAAALADVGALVYVRALKLQVHCTRQVRPLRVARGAPCRVEIQLDNNARRSTPALALLDPVGNEGLQALVDVPPLPPGGLGRVHYALPTDQRGPLRLGPLALVVQDPFGLAVSHRQLAGVATVLVYPRVEEVAGLPPAPGYDPNPGEATRSGRAQGEDFFALRPYEVGDDLRRVHWPSSARADDLMIRQMELPDQQRATVLVDVRRSVHDHTSFEAAVSAAASIITASHRGGAYIRLMTTAGFDSGFQTGPTHWEALMSVLASVHPSSSGGMTGALSGRHSTEGASVAVVTTDRVGPGDWQSLSRISARSGTIFLVLIRRSPGTAVPSGRGLEVIPVLPDRPLAAAWRP
jgi:uncharacterized protein (DUF58 family)